MSSSTTAFAFLQTPLDVVQDCFLPPSATATTTSSTGSSTSPHARVADAYRAFLQAHPEALTSIPLIKPATWAQDSAASGRLHNHCLVCFRGMVTDMLDPQFFIGAHKDPNTGKVLCTMYRDGLTAEEEKAMPVGGEWQPHQTMERRPLILGPIPGEAAWVTRTTTSSSSNSTSSNKRPLSEGEDAMVTSTTSSSSTTTMNEETAAAEGRTKMARTEERANNDNEGMMAVDDSTINTTTASSSSSMPPPPPRAKKAADASPSPPPFRCLTYFYDNEEDGAHPPKLNEALDVLAVLSYTTAAEKENMMMEGEGEGGGAEGGAVGMDEDDPDAAMDRLMLSLEPRLHVLLWERASLLPPTTTSDTTAAAAASDMSSSASSAFAGAFAGAASPSPRPLPLLLPPHHTITQARTKLLTHFTHALAGDALAAEYLLLSLISRVRHRTTAAAAATSGAAAGGEVVVGPLPLNLSRVSIPGFALGLQALLGSVVARVATVEVSLPSLGDASKWIPRKDYESNMLLSSTPLQAAPGTVLILDETGLEAGRLDGVGVTNVRCVKKLIEEQKTMCGFGYYELEFEADCPILVISKSRSIFSGGALCEVPLLPSSTAAAASTEAAGEAAAAVAVGVPPASLEGVVGPEVLPSLRRYLAALSGSPVEIDKALASQAEEEYVTLRGEGTEEGKQLTPEDLGRWLEMTRWLCASEGGGKACGVRDWGRVKEMEGERRRRVKAAQGGNVAQ